MNLVQGNLALMKDTQLMSLFLSPVLAIACHTFFINFTDIFFVWMQDVQEDFKLTQYIGIKRSHVKEEPYFSWCYLHTNR